MERLLTILIRSLAVFCLVLVLMIVLIQGVRAATLSWQLPTTWSDGSPLASSDIQQITIYCDGVKLQDVPGAATSATVQDCSQYTATAWAGGKESDQSLPVVLDLRTPASPAITCQTCAPCPVCPVCDTPTPEAWKVASWGSRLNWNVYAISQTGQRTDTVIGNLTTGTDCGSFFAPYRDGWSNWSWRRVTVPSGNGPDLVGVTVCKKE